MERSPPARKGNPMRSPLNIILVVFLVLLLIGLLPAWPYSTGWGYYPSGGIGLLLILAIVILVISSDRGGRPLIP